MSEYGPEMEGRTATSKDRKTRIVVRNGEWVRDWSYRPPADAQSATTTNADMKAMGEANARAAAERDATPLYLSAAQAIDGLGDTGPWKAALMDAGAPGQSEPSADRGWLANAFGGVAGLIPKAAGALYRPTIPRKVLAARDSMRSIAAQGALSRTAQLKGAASDRDMAMVRVAGLDPSKLPEENRRIVKSAIRDGGLNQTRALVTNQWISDNGSLKARNRNGKTFQEVLQRAEQMYGQRFTERQAERHQGAKSLPKPPPSRKASSAGRPVTIDLNGNIVE